MTFTKLKLSEPYPVNGKDVAFKCQEIFERMTGERCLVLVAGSHYRLIRVGIDEVRKSA